MHAIHIGHLRKTLPAVLALLAAAALAGQAAAGVAIQVVRQTGSGLCQGALPAFAGTLRARPLAIQNEGATVAFATCVVPGRLSPWRVVDVAVVNQGATHATVSCTLVHGDLVDPLYPPIYAARTVDIAAGTVNRMYLDASDFTDLEELDHLRMSCALPPGTGIADIHYATVADF